MVETAPYGSESVAARHAVLQSMGLQTAPRYLGVMVRGPMHLLGENCLVVANTSLPNCPLKKRLHALSYHFTHESMASGAINFCFILGHMNPAHILRKHWGYQKVWTSTLRPLLFWIGDTSLCLDIDDDGVSYDHPDNPINNNIPLGSSERPTEREQQIPSQNKGSPGAPDNCHCLLGPYLMIDNNQS